MGAEVESLFRCDDYKAYLRIKIGGYRERSGARKAAAEALGCQPTFVTQVLNSSPNLSVEQAYKLNKFLGHNDAEADFFILLVQKARSGTVELTKYFNRKLNAIRIEQGKLTTRLGVDTVLSAAKQSVYYSSWHYAAIHIACAISGLNTRDTIAEHFKLAPMRVAQILTYLASTGLIIKVGEEFTIGTSSIRLGNDSANIIKHHTNWRLRAIDSLDHERESDLHYSGVICISESDKQKIKSKIFEALGEHLAISDKSNEELTCCYNIDLFDLKR